MSGSDSVAQDMLQAFVRRIESLEDEIGALNGDKSEVYKEAKGNGFDTKVLRKVIADRRKDNSERALADELYQLYWDAVHGNVRAHIEIIEEFSNSSMHSSIPEHDADGVIIEPQQVVQPDPAIGGKLASDLAASGLAGPAFAEDAQQANIKPAFIHEPEAVPPAAPVAAGRDSADPSAAPAERPDRTKPNPWCLDPEECGVGSWEHFCLRCTRVKAERQSVSAVQ